MYSLPAGRYTRWYYHRAFLRLGRVSLLPFFCLDGIKKYRHFCFEQDHPGVVFLKKTATAEEETRCLLWGVWSPSLEDKPPLVPATGLSLERRRYLFERIREYFREESKDAVCPDPSLLIHQPPEIHPVPSTKSLLLSTLKRWTSASVRSPLSFLNPMSRCTLHRILRRGCKAVGPRSMTLTIVTCSRQIFVP